MPSPPDRFLPYGRQLIEDDDVEAVVRALRSDYLTTGEPGRFYAFKGWDGRGGLRIPGLK